MRIRCIADGRPRHSSVPRRTPQVDTLRSAKPPCAVVRMPAGTIMLSIGLMLILSLAALAQSTGASEAPTRGMSLPGETCRVDPLPGWHASEKWAWNQICEGQRADFNSHLGIDLDPRNPDHHDKWSDERELTSRFLETILLHEPFLSAIPYAGVLISGAYFPHRIDIAGYLPVPLEITGSRFDSEVHMEKLITPSRIFFRPLEAC